MTLKEQLQLDIHEGEHINGMIRFNGYYLSQNNDDSQTIIFDNGNQYTLDAEGEVTERIDANAEIFIDRQIIKTVIDFINCKSIMTKDYNYTHSNYDDRIEIYKTSKNDKKQRDTIIVIVVNRISKRIDIPNIMITGELKHHGIGKGILREIFEVTEKHNYKLHLVQMVESFYNRMVKRSAKIIVPYDVVEINKNTNLTD